MKTGLESLDTGAPKITYSSNEGPKSPKKIQMASYEPGDYTDEELEAYENYKYNMNEQMPGMPIMEIDEFLRMERSPMKEGGIMGSNAGSMLVAPTADGSRPGYYGPDEAHMSDPGVSTSKETAASFNRGEGSGISDRDAERVLAARSDLQAGVDAAKAAKEAERLAAQKEQERIQALLESYRGKTPEAYASTKFGKAIKPYDFSKPPQTFFGLIPTAVHIAKKIKTNFKDKELR